jgi:hypothetical protein
MTLNNRRTPVASRLIVLAAALIATTACGEDQVSRDDTAATSSVVSEANEWSPLGDTVEPPLVLEAVRDGAGCIDLLEEGKSVLIAKFACEDSSMSLNDATRLSIQLVGMGLENSVFVVVDDRQQIEVTSSALKLTDDGLVLLNVAEGEDVGIRNLSSTCWISRAHGSVSMDCG